MTEAERRLLIALARVAIGLTATRHMGHDEELVALLDAVLHEDVPDPGKAA